MTLQIRRRGWAGLEQRAPGSLAKDLATFGRYARRLPRFLRETVTVEEGRRRIEEQLAHRERIFLDILERGVYQNPRSPYGAMLNTAGVEHGDVAALVDDLGLEGALGRLLDAGVYVTLDEFKGRKPLERNGVAVPAGHAVFDNPLNSRHYEGASGGSSGVRRRVSIDLDLIEYEAAYHALFRTAFSLWERPFGIWRAIPPSASGINNALRQVKLGQPVAVWFTPYKAPPGPEGLKFGLFTSYTVRVGRLFGAGLVAPRHCPPDQANRVARWLAECKRRGQPAVLDTQAALAVRACLAAEAEGLDIAGTFFRVGGEPHTSQKSDVAERLGCRAVCHYTMSEMGRVAVACGDPASHDDMHFLHDKLAVIQRAKNVDASGIEVGAFHYTTLLPSSPKLMLNVESEDYGVLTERTCGCPFGELGFMHHMSGIRSYEKLTSEGNHFLGSDLLELVDRVLPARFGGNPSDYQLVEEEIGGLPKVNVFIRPLLGPVDEPAVVSAVLGHLRSERRNQLMADVWRDGRTVAVVRAEPYMTAAGKILPLHVASRQAPR